MPRPDFPAAPAPPRHLPTELLRRYVAGELPPAEEHAVEAHTLECDQCADVLEGLEMRPAAVTDASLAELRHRLHARVAELATETPETATLSVPQWNWRPLAAAAALLFTLGLAVWLLLIRQPGSSPEVASRPQQAQRKANYALNSASEAEIADLDEATPMAEPTAPTVALPLPAAPEVAVVRPAAAPRQLPVGRSRGGKSARNQEPQLAAADVAVADQVSPEPITTAAPPAVAAAASETSKLARATKSAPLPAAAPDIAIAATEPSMGVVARTVQGRITDQAGQPVPGATVLVPGTKTGVSTDADGRFALAVPPLASQLAISSIGYTTQTRALRPTDSTLALALAPDNKQLSEVVVVRREAPPGLPSVGPLPAGGYPAFRQYLRDSLDYPDKAREKQLQGYVRLQFLVGVDGKLSDIKVTSKLSPECDEEAIRLLKEGPAWFPGVQSNRRTARKVEVKVPFSLEEK
ncbi:hypothetical protein CDA63_04460 [Hymenobacter amundsenii]|uniref:TonB C-terminal domain-containing protein n=1 Tax=Hymenobacter amundsenii TaxID=2006685 RepID=A0A246FNH4_9BACT|nr:TonB family protein [Hymenobacter amundsenii]OWP64297.1 hypothetical protein CDA63_04460 [Hymenobacter amundsenii]